MFQSKSEPVTLNLKIVFTMVVLVCYGSIGTYYCMYFSTSQLLSFSMEALVLLMHSSLIIVKIKR